MIYVGYSKAGWASDIVANRFTGDYVFILQGDAVSCCSCKRQTTVTLSTCDAEYMALCATVQEASQFREENPIELRCDKQNTVYCVK